jgi:hypothetical protein
VQKILRGFDHADHDAVNRSKRQIFEAIFLIRSAAAPWIPAVCWVTVAALSVGVAAYVGLQPEHLGDLRVVRKWLHYWTTSGQNPYDYFSKSLDYPPVAFLVLWPLSLPSDSSVAYWFLPAGVCAIVLAGWFLLRWMGERMYIALTTSERIALVALMLSGGGARTSLWLGQTVALSLLFGALAMRWSRRRPYAAAIALTLCAFKPHVALGFGLGILLVEGPGVLILSGAMTLSLSTLFALSVGKSLLEIGAGFVRNLWTIYAGPDAVQGFLSMRYVIWSLFGDSPVSVAIYVASSLACLASLVVLSVRRRRDAVTQTHIVVASILWSVVFLPHQLYSHMLVAPALWLLMWPESGVIKRPGMRAAITGAYVLFGVVDVPRALRFLASHQPEFSWLYLPSYYLSPLRVAAVFALILWSLYRRPSAGWPAGTS